MGSSILGIVPTMQSLALAADNVAFVKDSDKDIADFGKQAGKNIIGVNLIGLTANEIGKF